jgi:hypothetical protein
MFRFSLSILEKSKNPKTQEEKKMVDRYNNKIETPECNPEISPNPETKTQSIVDPRRYLGIKLRGNLRERYSRSHRGGEASRLYSIANFWVDNDTLMIYSFTMRIMLRVKLSTELHNYAAG